MSGGKGGSTSSSVEIPEYIEKAAQRNLNKAERISQLGYVPYYGPDVAAFTPMQQASFQNTADVAGAFGMSAPTSQQDIMGGMGAPTQYANGLSGYSSAPIYQQSLDELERQRPGQKSYMDSFFIDPYSGSYGSNALMPIDYNDYNTNAEAQRMTDMRREQRSDDNYQRLLDQMGQQSVNSDIDYTDGFTASNGQTVGILDPSYDSNFSGTTYSASPFEIESSTAGTNYATYDESQGFTAPGTYGMLQNLINPRPEDQYDASFQNPNTTSIVSMGYDVGEVDPRLAAAAGYTDQTKLREDGLAKKAGDYGIFSGRGTDGQGNFGVVGDLAGAVGDMTGFTSYNTPDVVAQRQAAEAQRMASERVARETALAQAEQARAAQAEQARAAQAAQAAQAAREQAIRDAQAAAAASASRNRDRNRDTTSAAQANSRAQIDRERDSYY